MLAFFVVFAVSLCALVGAPGWIIPAGGLVLATISYIRHVDLFQRAADQGLQDAIDGTLWTSAFNGLVACTMSYGAGWIIRLSTLAGA